MHRYIDCRDANAGRAALLGGLFFFVCLILTGCGGGNSSERAEFEFSGYWDARYNVIIDECGLTNPGLSGFTDQYTVAQTGSSAVVCTPSSLVDVVDAVVREDGSLLATDTGTADFGIICSVETDFTLSELDGDIAQSLFSLVITCPDGWTCQSRGVGQAFRYIAERPELDAAGPNPESCS